MPVRVQRANQSWECAEKKGCGGGVVNHISCFYLIFVRSYCTNICPIGYPVADSLHTVDLRSKCPSCTKCTHTHTTHVLSHRRTHNSLILFRIIECGWARPSCVYKISRSPTTVLQTRNIKSTILLTYERTYVSFQLCIFF